MTHRYYALEEQGAKFYDNLPLVREAEAEARDLALSTGLLPQGNRSQPDKQKLPRHHAMVRRSPFLAKLTWTCTQG